MCVVVGQCWPKSCLRFDSKQWALPYKSVSVLQTLHIQKHKVTTGRNLKPDSSDLNIHVTLCVRKWELPVTNLGGHSQYERNHYFTSWWWNIEALGTTTTRRRMPLVNTFRSSGQTSNSHATQYVTKIATQVAKPRENGHHEPRLHCFWELVSLWYSAGVIFSHQTVATFPHVLTCGQSILISAD